MKKASIVFLFVVSITNTFSSSLEIAIAELEVSRTREIQHIERKAQSDLLKCQDLKCRDEVSIEKYKSLSELNERAYLYLKNLIQN